MANPPAEHFTPAVRAWAYKWIRIIFRLWKSRERSSEQIYLRQLIHTNSPLVPFMQTGETL